MNILIYLVVSVVYILLVVEQICMLIRAVISWITQDDESPFATFLYYVTEPIIAPLRLLLGRFDVVNELPIDIPFMAAALLISVLLMVLPTVAL